MNRLSIIILSFNTKDFTLACIDSIINQYKDQLENGEFETIIVDNASTDSSVESIKKHIRGGKNIHLIQNGENVGFSKGNNIGAKEARGKYFLFLNSDTIIKNKCLVEMIDFLEKNNQVGVLGGKLVGTDGMIESSCGNFYSPFNVFLMLVLGEKVNFVRFAPRNLRPVDWVGGAALMIRKDLFKRLGGFDGNFFMYIEDMELCFRVRKTGLLTYFYPFASISHKSFGSSNRTFAILNIYKGLLYFYQKHTNYMEYLIVKLLLIVKACIAIVIGMVTRNSYLTSTYRKALALSI